MYSKKNPGIFNHSDTLTEVSPFFSVSEACWIASLSIEWTEAIDNVTYGTLEMMGAFQWTQGRAKSLCCLCFPGFNWDLGWSVLLCFRRCSSVGTPWGCTSFRAYPSAPVISRGHSVYVVFCPWNTLSCFFTDLEVHSAFSSPFFPSLLCILVFVLALQYVFREVTPALVMLPVPCVWVECGAAWQQFFSGLFTQRPSCSPPAANTLPHKLMENQTKAKHNPTADLNGMNINNLEFVFLC